MKSNHRSAIVALWHFGFKQSRRGAIIMGLVAGGMAILQGYAYAASYTNTAAQAAFSASLASVPGLGVIYGEPANLISPAGYIVYRTVAFLGLIAAIWATLAATRMFRGQEEDGRWELIASGATSLRRASASVFGGFLTAFLLSFGIAGVILAASSASPSLHLSFWGAVRIASAVYLPALAFASLGYITSQLAITRRRALSYSLYPLVGVFVLRAIGNTIPDLYWLKNLSPFGWAERFNPILDPQYGWFALLAVVIISLASLAIYLVGKRDIGASLIRESDHVRSKYALLGSSASLAIRQTTLTTLTWAISAVGMSFLMAAVAKVAVQAVEDSPALKAAFLKIGSSADIQIAFLSVGSILTVMILLLVATAGIASVRSSEAKNYLDTILVAPVRRSRWLLERLGIITVSMVAISALSMFTTWAVATSQHVSINLGNVLLTSVTMVGTAIFTLGLGTLLYGVAPRFAAASMYVLVGWSFLIDTLSSVVSLNDIVVKSSLFHYVMPSLTGSPDWKTFVWLVGLGVAMVTMGLVCFNRRDIISE